jgi:Tol biopolymer transport system component
LALSRGIGPLAVLPWVVILLAVAAPAQAAFPGDNGKIAFVRNVGTSYQIFVANSDGSGVTQLTTGTTNGNPIWSPSGNKIAFTSARDDPNPTGCYPNCNYEIYAMNADGSGQTNLTNASCTGHDPDVVS